jgi:hypothetical protein
MVPVATWAAPTDDPGRREAMEQRRRTRVAIGITEALGLSEAEALRVAAQLRTFDERRRPLRDQMREAMDTLERAARGDSGAFGQVDAATSRLLEAREKMALLDKEMFASLSKDLTPQRKAQLALVLAKLHRHGKGQGEARGPGRWMRPMGRE